MLTFSYIADHLVSIILYSRTNHARPLLSHPRRLHILLLCIGYLSRPLESCKTSVYEIEPLKIQVSLDFFFFASELITFNILKQWSRCNIITTIKLAQSKDSNVPTYFL